MLLLTIVSNYVLTETYLRVAELEGICKLSLQPKNIHIYKIKKKIKFYLCDVRELIIARKQVDEHVVPSKTVTNQWKLISIGLRCGCYWHYVTKREAKLTSIVRLITCKLIISTPTTVQFELKRLKNSGNRIQTLIISMSLNFSLCGF